MSEGAKTFMRAVIIAVLIGAFVLGGVLLFMRAFEQTKSAGASAAVSQMIDSGLAKFEAGDTDGAINVLKEARAAAISGPEHEKATMAIVKVYNEMAVKAHSAGDGRTAETLWLEALKYDEKNEVVLDNLTDYYKLKGDSSAADRMRAAKDGRVGAENPAAPGDYSRNDARQADAQQLYIAGKQAYDAGRFDEAKQFLTKAIEKGTGTDIGRNATELLGQLNDRQTGTWDPGAP
jgi:hypothetical protein